MRTRGPLLVATAAAWLSGPPDLVSPPALSGTALRWAAAACAAPAIRRMRALLCDLPVPLFADIPTPHSYDLAYPWVAILATPTYPRGAS